MSDIDITIGNARVQLQGEVRKGLSDRNKVGASAEDFIVDDVLHAVSRMMSTITDNEVNALMQTQLTYLRETARAASKGICGFRCYANNHVADSTTCRLYWEIMGRIFSPNIDPPKESRWTGPLV